MKVSLKVEVIWNFKMMARNIQTSYKWSILPYIGLLSNYEQCFLSDSCHGVTMQVTFNCFVLLSSNHQPPEASLFCIYLTLISTSDDGKAMENLLRVTMCWSFENQPQKLKNIVCSSQTITGNQPKGKMKHNVPS